MPSALSSLKLLPIGYEAKEKERAADRESEGNFTARGGKRLGAGSARRVGEEGKRSLHKVEQCFLLCLC